MTKLVLDCDAVQSVGDQIQSLSTKIDNIADSINGYSIGDTDFDFATAKNSIALNVKGASQKIKNTSKLIDIVIDTHINLQNSLKFTVPNINTKNTSSVTNGQVNTNQTKTYGRNTSNTSASFSPSSATNVVTAATTAAGTIGTQNVISNNTSQIGEEIKIQDNNGIKNINIPSGLGKQHTYMGWQTITNKTSNQYKFRETVGMNFDEEGFGRVGDRYVIACTSTFGNVGDLIDFKQSDGTVIKCVIGDIKSQSVTSYDRNPANTWGHNDGKCIVEFVVDKNSWYNSNHVNPGNETCHPEWNDYIVSATNYGSYYDLV